MTVREFEILIQTYEEQALKTGKQRPITQDEKLAMNQNLEKIPPEYSEAFANAEAGNFSQFDSLPLILKTYLGAIKVGQLREKFKNDLSLNNEELKSYLKEHAMDVSLRTGISVEKNSKDEANRDIARAFDTFMNSYVMQSTIMPPTDEEKQALRKSMGEEEANLALAKDLKRQRVLAKTYFLAQLGKYDILNDNGLGKSFDLPLSETLAHGSRTNFILPSGTDTKQVIDAFMGTHDGEDPVIEERTAATHHVKRRAVSKNGLIKSETKESRTYSPLKIFGHQYGMDLSVGGIGKKGPNGKVISGNGESGHAYMRIEEGDEKHCASLLFGIEGSAPGKDSALGHSHGASGVSANQSAFFTDKQVIGAKNGGRQVDLSGLDSKVLADLLKDFDKKYAELQKNANTPKGLEQLSRLNEMLMGKHMNREAFAEMLTVLDINDKTILETFDTARMGYFNTQNVNVGKITEEDFKQSFRAKFSQEKACSIAKARFAYAEKRLESDAAEAEEDSLELATGAIKELMLTHETRSTWWKIRHPIKNYRENKTISNLMTRLEKKFEKEAIVSAFGFYDNTFALNWGEGLSNDRHAVKFAKVAAGSKMFKPSVEKQFDIFKKVREDIRKKVSPKEVAEREQTAMREEFAHYEPEQFKDSELGLPKEPKGEYTEDYVRMMRQQIVINEENEANKIVEVGEEDEIIPEQPTITNQREF